MDWRRGGNWSYKCGGSIEKSRQGCTLTASMLEYVYSPYPLTEPDANPFTKIETVQIKRLRKGYRVAQNLGVALEGGDNVNV